MEVHVKLIIFVLLFCLLFFLFVRYLESTSIFFPSNDIVNTPGDINLTYEEIVFKSQDNVSLSGWFIPCKRASFTIIFFHGNAGNISDRLDKIALFHELGANTFIVDYRGYGKSDGTPSEQGLYKDATGAFDYLNTRKDIDPKRIIAYGASLGGVVAIDLAVKRDLAALIVDSSFTRAADMSKRIYPFIPTFLLKTKMDSLSKIKKAVVPKIFLHSPDDEVVPYEMGKELYMNAAGPKSFLVINGNHNDGYFESRDRYVKGLGHFLKNLK